VQKQAQFLAFLERQLGNRAEAEDVLQTAYMKALTEVEMIRSDATVVAWFYRLLRNLLVDRHRQRAAAIRRQARLTHDIPAMTERDDAPHPTVSVRLDLAQALKPSYREVSTY
jgi:RNA polymerase sigma-70 factor (ECF subfamily)